MKVKAKLKYAAVIFDMDGVITNTMPYHFKAWAEVFRLKGIKVNRYDVYSREGKDGFSSVKEIYGKYQRNFSVKEARLLLKKKEGFFKQCVKVSFVRGSRSFLRKLKKQGTRLALVTGTSRHEAEKILHKGLMGIFDASVTGDEVRRSKPHPEPFLKALKLLKVPARQAIVIENAPLGIASAKKAGLACVALETSLPAKYLREADYIFKSFSELEIAMRFIE